MWFNGFVFFLGCVRLLGFKYISIIKLKIKKNKNRSDCLLKNIIYDGKGYIL